MRKIVIGFAVVWLGALAGVIWAQDLNWDDLSSGNHNAQVILVNPNDSKIIFAGMPGSILKSEDGGNSWRTVLSIRSAARNINALTMNPSNHNVVYAAADNGLYRSNNSGGRWDRIFRGRNNLENRCLAVLNTPLALFAGTSAGLFISRDNGRSWDKENKIIGNTAVLNLDYCHNQNSVIYLAAASGIFKSSDYGKNWERIFLSHPGEDNQNEFDGEEADIPEESSDIRFVKAGINNANLVYFSCAKGVYRSLDQGRSWDKLSEHGLLNRDVKMLCLSGSLQIFALSQSGVFIYEDGRWREVSFGLSAGKLNYFTLDTMDNIYVAAEGGIFKAKQDSQAVFIRQGLIQEYIKDEPKIKEVQEAAIKYAEVGPEKISQWRKKAAKKALLPQVSVGLDRNTTDLWHWEGGSTTKTDDDILRRGRDNLDWDVSLSWDLSNLIWDDAQTSIDVRSKLMVELRDDILDQVNKLYFERLRIKSELNNLAIEDRNKRFDKQLKLEELTASLDALTSGYYSQQLRKLSPKKQS
ncbi:MAG: hypothetical protein PHP73_02390 [Candidatus Omnitrophica bacterium]|nr:hypothetical protein [Candidatus Omnitrophota bacterium]